MKRLTSSRSMQRLGLSWRQTGAPVVIVPTMGFLHAGHAALIREGKRLAGKKGHLVVSIFVNPTQFSPFEDFSRYPRSEKADLELCQALGANAVFIPRASEIYPKQTETEFSTFVSEERLSGTMEGQSRPTHFRGVATIVTILLNLTQATHAVFGEKDFQQFAVIRKLVQDLKIPSKIKMGKTVREPDGLALSSRNAYLSPQQRPHATILWQCIRVTKKRIKQASKPVSATKLRRQLAKMIEATPHAKLDYIEFFDPATLAPVNSIQSGHRIALAVRFGRTRLIDNSQI